MQDFLKQQADFFKKWQQNQEGWAKEYASWTEKFMEPPPGNKKEELADLFAGWRKTQERIMEQFAELGNRMNTLINDSHNFPKEYLKLMNYSLFEKNYKEFLSHAEEAWGTLFPKHEATTWQEASKVFQSFLEHGTPLTSAMFDIRGVTNAVNQTIRMIEGTWGQSGQTISGIVQEYQDLMGRLSENATSLFLDEFVENLSTWKEQIQKYLSAPPLGVNRELIQDLAKGLDLSLEYVLAYSKLLKVADAASRKAAALFQAKLSEMALNEKPVTKFTELLALWTKESEPIFIDVLRSEEFARYQGDLLDTGHRLNIQWTKLAEKILEPTPVALKRDLDLAIAEIHRMKREIRNLREELKKDNRKAAVAPVSEVLKKGTASKAKIILKTAAATRYRDRANAASKPRSKALSGVKH